MASFVRVLALLVAMVSGLVSSSSAVCEISGTATAEASDRPELGLYKYTISVAFETDTNPTLSHFDVRLLLAGCPCLCDISPIAFADTAGVGTGTDGNGDPCLTYYGAEFSCTGDPTIPIDDPVVKFELLPGECDATSPGTADASFYSDWEPTPIEGGEEALVLKAGSDLSCFGPLTGDLPTCECAVPSERSSWGSVKFNFRD